MLGASGLGQFIELYPRDNLRLDAVCLSTARDYSGNAASGGELRAAQDVRSAQVILHDIGRVGWG